jgi:prepilin-type N-terminal cleavage/methylation domain-containing protein
MKKRIGFTLMELLVVIAIIGLLMAIMLPSLTRVKRIGRRIVCGSNERQIIFAATTAAQDNYGKLPRGGYHDETADLDMPWIMQAEEFFKIGMTIMGKGFAVPDGYDMPADRVESTCNLLKANNTIEAFTCPEFQTSKTVSELPSLNSSYG